jgi:histidinol-phosphate aminotransferase
MGRLALDPVPALAGQRAYAVPRLPTPIDLVLDGNEGLVPPPELLAELAMVGPDALRRYPDATALAQKLAARHGVAADQVAIGAGADELIDRLCRAFLAPGRELVLPSPSFVMFPHYAALAQGTLVKVPWPAGPWPLERVCAALGPRTALVAFVTPNNPTGAVASAHDLRTVSRAAEHALVIVDLAYAEFADEDLTEVALALPNSVVLRTFSKALGLAGLRVGYALGAPELIAVLKAAGGPYSVARLSLLLAERALDVLPGASARFVAEVRRERVLLVEDLRALGARATPSQANFVLAAFANELWVQQALAGLGIGVRRFPGDPELSGALRITLPGEPAAFERLRHALRTALAPQALVFDLDGARAAQRRMPARALLERLAERLPLALTTGRPRQEVERSLADAGVAALFRVVLGAEDAPPEPDPSSLRLCLARLGVERAWHVGDTARDATAARAAGLVPLGILPPLAPDQDLAPARAALFAAGAGRILDRLDDLETLLP